MLARSLPAPAPLYPAHGCLLPLLGVLSGHLPTLVTATNYKHKPIAHGRNLTLLGAKFAICLQILLSQQNEDGCVKLSSLFETEKAWAWRHMPFSLVLALWAMAESTDAYLHHYLEGKRLPASCLSVLRFTFGSTPHNLLPQHLTPLSCAASDSGLSLCAVKPKSTSIPKYSSNQPPLRNKRLEHPLKTSTPIPPIYSYGHSSSKYSLHGSVVKRKQPLQKRTPLSAATMQGKLALACAMPF